MAKEKEVDQRQVLRRSAWVRVALIVLLAGLFFAVAQQSHWRSDWTQDQVYSLSESTKKTLSKLQEPISIKAYITEGLPQPYGRLKRFIDDILQAYHEAGGGQVDYALVNPSDDANIAAALAALNIPKVQVQVVEDDQAQVKQGYLAVVVEYLDRKETIPVVQSEEGFEYLLTRKIKKLIHAERPKVAFANTVSARHLIDLRLFSQFVHDDYDVQPINLEKEEVPTDIQALIIAALQAKPSQSWRQHLQAFRQRGGRVWLLAGNALPQLSQGFQVQAVATDAYDWLRDDFHVAVATGLVMDQQAQRVVVQNGGFRTQVDYPFVGSVLDLNKQHILTRDLASITMPFASPLLALNDDMQVLMASSEHTAIQAGPPFDVYPLMEMSQRFAGLQQKPVTLALLHEDKQGGFLIMGAAGFLDNEFMSGTGLIFTLNCMDWLVGEEDLIALRSRDVTDRPLAALSNAGRTFFKLLWIFALPLLIVVLGTWRWWRIKQRRESVDA